jgi:mono/diheme cytochrome c family protein
MFLLCAALVWAADGKRVFNERCVGCHGKDARGGGKGPGLAGSPRLSALVRTPSNRRSHECVRHIKSEIYR